MKSKKNRTAKQGHKYFQVTVPEMPSLILRQWYLHMHF